MRVSEILNRIDEPEVTKKTVEVWLKTVDPERDLRKVENLRIGDTFFYTVVGGKRRPWVVLWVRKGTVGAASLTHTNMAGAWACQDRMWGEGCYIGPTLITVEEDRVKGSVYFPYTNLKHLREVKDHISKMWKT